jgi:hypothetical protein
MFPFVVTVSELPFGETCSMRYETEEAARTEFLVCRKSKVTISCFLQKRVGSGWIILDSFESRRKAVVDPRDEMLG